MKKKKAEKRKYLNIGKTKLDSSYFSRTYIHVDEDAKRRKYRFIKTYEHFVLLERLDNGCKECFYHGEYNQLEVID